MTLQEILQLFGLTGGTWTAIGMALLLWLWHACSDWSRIPLDKAWRPVAMVVVGVAYGSIQSIAAGQDAKTAIAHGVSMAVFSYGLGALVLEAAFKGKLPPWLATILALFPVPTEPPPPPPAAGAAAAVLFVALLGLSQEACIESTTHVVVTPDNQAAVASCQGTTGLHNGSVVAGLVLGAGATGSAATAAALPSGGSNDNTKVILAATGAAAAALATGAGGVAAFTASAFASNHCADYVYPPPLKPGQAHLLPSFSEMGGSL